MSIQDLCDHLTAAVDNVVISVDGVYYPLHPKDPPPPTWDTAALPGHYILTGGADDTPMGDDGGVVEESRIVRVQVPVVPLGQATPYERETRSRALLDALKQQYRIMCRSARITGVRSMRVLGDSGVVVLPEYDGQYIGFEIRLEVKMLIDP
jgi:hypothetical protein